MITKVAAGIAFSIQPFRRAQATSPAAVPAARATPEHHESQNSHDEKDFRASRQAIPTAFLKAAFL
jgi:hypothetical protein